MMIIVIIFIIIIILITISIISVITIVIRLQFINTRAMQPVATCRQSPYLHKLAIVIVTSLIMTSFSL